MFKEFFPKSFVLLALGILTIPVALALYSPATVVSAQTGETSGALTVVDAQGRAQSMCPLKHTDVKADISGFISRVTVTQQFENPFKDKIEAVYTFPLPQNAAVDDMTMLIGERTIKGKILPREEAQAAIRPVEPPISDFSGILSRQLAFHNSRRRERTVRRLLESGRPVGPGGPRSHPCALRGQSRL